MREKNDFYQAEYGNISAQIRHRFSDRFSIQGGVLAERGHWDEYMECYDDMIRATARPHAPWIVVPADNKWYTRLVVSSAIVEALASVDLHYPRMDDAARAQLAESRARLLAE